MGKLKPAALFAKSAKGAVKGGEEAVRRSSKEGQGFESLPPHCAIRHGDLRAFWEKCIGKEEVPWDTFWLHFPTGLAPNVLVDCTFSSERERSAFQSAVHIVGAPEHVNVSMIDAAFPPGCPLGVTTARLLGNAETEKRLVELAKASIRNVPLRQQCAGFWDEAPLPLPSLAGLAVHIEAALSVATGQQPSVVRVIGHLGSGAASVAAAAAKRLMEKGSWSSAVYVSLKGACSADIAAARVATSLDVLSYPVVADELLRLTAFLHTMAGKAGHIGIVLDAEGVTRPDALQGFLVLLTTMVKAGGRSLHVIIAGEGSLPISVNLPHMTFHVPPPSREEETAFLESAVRADYLGTAGSAVAAACCHQAALLQLAAANLRTGRTTPQTLLDAMCARVPGAETARGKARSLPAETVVAAVMSTLPPAQQDALYRLSVLPQAFTVPAAAKVLGQQQEADPAEVLSALQEKGFLRHNVALCCYGMLPSIRAIIRNIGRQKNAATYESAIAGLLEYSLELAETAGALNAANAQVAAMRAIDRERQIFDEVANLLHSRTLLPAVTTALYADLVSQHMELLGFRLSFQQQQELCLACAEATRREGDMLAEAHCLQHLGQLGNIQAADTAMARSLTTLEKALTPSHPVIADMLLSWARLQSQAGNNHQAERLLRKSLEIQLQHPEGQAMAIAATQTRLAGVLIGLNASHAARPYLQSALEATLKQLGRHHPDTALAQCRLASCLADLREYESAHALYLMALDGWRQSLGHCHPQFATLLGQLAFCCRRLGKPADAEQYHRRSIQMWKEMMVLDQQELQDDLKALSDLFQSQGRNREFVEIHQQLHKLAEAVRAARQRVACKPASFRRSLKKALLRPFKALFGSSPKAKVAFVALPAGIQDSDLEEIRNAARAQEPASSMSSPLSTTRQSAFESTVGGEVTERTGGAATQRSGSTAFEDSRSSVGNANSTTMGSEEGHPNGASDAATELGQSLVTVKFNKHGDDEQCDSDLPESAKSGTKGRTDKSASRAKEMQPQAPFGSKGPGPTTVESGIWAASLRNPAIPLGNIPKRTSGVAPVPRNDSSAVKNRLFTTSDSRSTRGGKSSATDDAKSPSGDGLIRAHLADDKDWANQPVAEDDDWRRSSSGYATDETIADGPSLGSHPTSAREELISRVKAADVSVLVDKNVIGFFNPMFAQQGLSRSNSGEVAPAEHKMES